MNETSGRSCRPRWRRGTVVLFFPVVLACGSPGPGPSSRDPDAVATYEGGAIHLTDLEQAFGKARTPVCREARRAGAGIDELVVCYRELAEATVFEQHMLGSEESLEEAVESLAGFAELRQETYAGAFLSEAMASFEITEEDVVLRLELEPPSGAEVVELYDLFLRHRDGEPPEATRTRLRQLRRRFEAGEPFEVLAREASESETRARGGRVGNVGRGRLPGRLEDVVFALREGDISDPVAVRGGAVLLHVRSRQSSGPVTLRSQRGRIRRELRDEHRREVIADRLGDAAAPPGSTVLGPEEILAALEGEDQEAILLAVGDATWTVADLRSQLRWPESRRVPEDEEQRAQVLRVVEERRQLMLLGSLLITEADPALRDVAEGRLAALGRSRLLAERIRASMRRELERDSGALGRYFEDNRQHYQSPVRLELRAWTVPFGDDPPAQLRRMEELRAGVMAGESNLEDAVDELGGHLEELGWRTLESLEGEQPPKALLYLAELEGSGLTVPFQQEDRLHLLEVRQRSEPGQLELGGVEGRVLEDYLQRHEEELYRRILDDHLEERRFAFHEDRLRSLLGVVAAESG